MRKIKKKEHLPVYGVGPVCVYLMVGLLIGALILRHYGIFDSGKVHNMRFPMIILGIVLLVFGVYMWIKAVIISKVGDEIVKNHLVTTGIYAYVRNPIYSGVALALTGIALMFCNWYFLILPVLFWLDITILMKFTEEKWLKDLYGWEYEEYCKKVNRCIPWPSKRR